jgi:hypothetical protein
VAGRKGAGSSHCGDNGGARKVVVEVENDGTLAPPKIQINRVVTCDDAFGCPWPPSDGCDGWTVVRRARGFTLWRSIRIVPSVPPSHDRANNLHWRQASKKELKDEDRREE